MDIDNQLLITDVYDIIGIQGCGNMLNTYKEQTVMKLENNT